MGVQPLIYSIYQTSDDLNFTFIFRHFNIINKILSNYCIILKNYQSYPYKLFIFILTKIIKFLYTRKIVIQKCLTSDQRYVCCLAFSWCNTIPFRIFLSSFNKSSFFRSKVVGYNTFVIAALQSHVLCFITIRINYCFFIAAILCSVFFKILLRFLNLTKWIYQFVLW